MDVLHEWVVNGLGFIDGLQQWRTPLLNTYFLFAAFLGQEEFLLISLPAVFWLYDKGLGRRMVYLMMLGTWSNEGFKNIFRLPRPPVEVSLVKEVGYGLPSGHAQLSVMLWGYAGWKLRDAVRWLPLLVLWCIASISFSRLYLGVHFPSDVLVGLVIGVLLLAVSLWAEPHLAQWYGERTPGQVVVLAAVLSILALVLMPTGGKIWPVELAATEAGLIFGVLVGLDVEKRRVRFAVAGSAAQKIGRYLLGLLLLVLVWAGLRAIFGLVDVGHLLAGGLRIVRYGVIGFTVTWFAPALFIRLGLAATE